MILQINTKDLKQVSVALESKGKIVDCLTKHYKFGSQVLLPLIDELLQKNYLGYQDLAGVKVETGPGSFTGLRIGVAVANALGFGIGIKVNGKKLETKIRY